MAGELEPVVVTAEQRERFRVLLVENPWRGHVHALRDAGVPGTRGALRQILQGDDELLAATEQACAARMVESGLPVTHLLKKLASIVGDDGNPSQFRAIQYALGMHGVSVAERAEVAVTHDGRLEVDNPDVAAAIDRFTALADAAIRSAARGGEGEAAGGALEAGEG